MHASVPVVYVILMSDELIKVPITLKAVFDIQVAERCHKGTKRIGGNVK